MPNSGILGSIFDAFVDGLKHVFYVDGRVSELQESMDSLNAATNDLRISIETGERAMQEPTLGVENWLQRVTAIESEVTSIKQMHEARMRCLGGLCFDCWSSFRIGSRAAEKLRRVQDLKTEGSAFAAATVDAPPPRAGKQPMSAIVEGDSVRSILHEVSDYLDDSSTSGEIAGIWGPGGIGKTTILKKINNSLQGNSSFDPVLFVVASKECTTQKIQHSIVGQLKLRKEDDVEEQARTIRHFLCNKKLVLLLDDVREYVDLDKVGLPASRKVVLTTRFDAVCGDMQAHRRIKVGFFTPEDARSLFLKNVGEPTLNCDPSIRGLAEEVIRECGGLPLAVVTIGKVMSSKRTPEEWVRVIKLLRNNQFLPGTDENLFSKLKLSFDFLKEDRERECFLCCALWPEDFNIRKEDLIDCWIEHDLLDDSSYIYLEGYSIIGNLLASCLLEPGRTDDDVKMHDVVRDMALWIVSQCGDKWVVRAGFGPREKCSIETTGLKIFTYEEIQDATNGLCKSSKIGQGGFGSVYKGSLADNTEVAIKVLDAQSDQGSDEFKKELRILGNTHHPHLVRLLGACSEPRSLVYEYVPNGSLHDCLSDRPEAVKWRTRVRIILELCSALMFLHSQKPQRLVHKDVKPKNVLLDVNYSAKLGDFGLSSYMPQAPGGATDAIHVTKNFQGTFGFMDPDYLEHGQIGPRCDVYALGITILIILSRLPALDILERVRGAYLDKKLMTIVDPAAGNWPDEVAEYLACIGLKCCEPERKCSTLMLEISSGLEDILHRKFHKELPVPSTVQASIQTVLDKVYDYLGDRGNSEEIAGIWGPGGIGKTTILKEINNSLAANSRFDLVLFVVASKECTTQKIQHSIVGQLKLRKEDDVEEQARTIHHFLRNKKFVLLLDDVWEYVDLEEVGLPTSRKVVLTTRFDAVCGDMQAHRRIKVGFLTPEDARSLFLKNVGEPTLNCDPSIPGLAEEVIRECGGLPLALVTIGKVMSSKRTYEEWLLVVKELKNNQFPPGTDENLFSKLKLSFDFLKEDRERECFLGCALWPEDYKIKKEDLIINCWMGHGLLDDSSNIYLKGYTIIGNLLASCLLEPAGDRYDEAVKMHDVVRDMALWIVSQRGDKWVVLAGLGITGEAHNSLGCHDWHGAQKISLGYNKITSLPSWIGMDSEKLNTLMLQDNWILKSSTNLPSWTYYSELKYLDLSNNINNGRRHFLIFSLDVFECMNNLEYLNLSRLWFTIHLDELPLFPNLKYLLLRNNVVIAQKQPSIPPKLLVLDVFNIYSEGVRHGMIIDGLYHHNQDNHNKWLALVGVHIHSLEEFGKASTLNIRSLKINEIKGHSSLNLADPDVLGNDYFKYGLRELWISECHDDLVELLVSGSPPTTLTSLWSLRLDSLTYLEKMIFKELAPADFFPRLRRITITYCNVLSHASWVLLLPCLEKLILRECDKMEYVIIDSQVKMELDREKRNIAFPRLKEFCLWSMPALVGVCDYTLTSVPPLLERFRVIGDCRKLRTFPFMRVATGSTMDGASSSSSKENRHAATTRFKLRIKGDQEWWDDLIWDVDDEDSRDYFQQFFQPFG